MADRLRSKSEDGLTVVEGNGRGVMSTRTFSKGQLLREYSGELITFSEAKRREQEYLKDASIGSLCTTSHVGRKRCGECAI